MPTDPSPGVERLGRESDHSLPSIAEVKNAWNCTSSHPYTFMAWGVVKHRDNSTFTVPLFYVKLKSKCNSLLQKRPIP